MCNNEIVRSILREHNYNAIEPRYITYYTMVRSTVYCIPWLEPRIFTPFISKVSKAKKLKYDKEHLKKNQDFWNNVPTVCTVAQS